jgi:hypothetical protein
MLARRGRFCRLIFCDTETKVRLLRDARLPQMLPQLSPAKLPLITSIPSRVMFPVALVAKMISPVTVEQAWTSRSASFWDVIVVEPQEGVAAISEI